MIFFLFEFDLASFFTIWRPLDNQLTRFFFSHLYFLFNVIAAYPLHSTASLFSSSFGFHRPSIGKHLLRRIRSRMIIDFIPIHSSWIRFHDRCLNALLPQIPSSHTTNCRIRFDSISPTSKNGPRSSNYRFLKIRAFVFSSR